MSNLSELLPSGGGQNQVEFVASGTLPNGKPVILKSNGQVEVVGLGSTPVSQNIPVGSEVVFNSGTTTEIEVAFDPITAGRFVIVYRNNSAAHSARSIVGIVSGTSIAFGTEVIYETQGHEGLSIDFDPNTANKCVVTYKASGNSSYGTAKVGTLSGNSISYGSASVFNSAATTNVSVKFDPNTANKCVVAYRNGSNGVARVGTVSGTSISFGSANTYRSSATSTNKISFDANTANKFLIAYQDYGSAAKVIIGTISGTSLSFGTAVATSAGDGSNIMAVYSAANKFVVAYSDNDNSNYGTAVVGTVSGTSITLGTEYIFNTGASYNLGLAIDSNTSNKFLVCYYDEPNGKKGNANVGTISGTSISYGSDIIFNTGDTRLVNVSFDPSNPGKFVIVYKDGGNSSYGTAILGQMASSISTTNLTATNLIGIAAEAASSGATAKINTWGGINEAQTSLTIGSDYYAQTNGTITTATGGQKLGTAISATTINMRDLP